MPLAPGVVLADSNPLALLTAVSLGAKPQSASSRFGIISSSPSRFSAIVPSLSRGMALG